MTTAIVVPARYASSRYPGKPLVPLTGARGTAKPLILRTYEAASAVPGVDRVVIATDDARIADAARAFGATVAMTPERCRNGTERCAAALDQLGDVETIVNLQGDAPLTPPAFISALLAAMQAGAAVATPVLRATPAVRQRLFDDQRGGRVGGTTAALAVDGRALYFSKSVIPHVPETATATADLPLFLHVGVYAYTRAALERYAALPPAPLELLEGLEQLRFLEHGLPVRAIEVAAPAHDIWELNNPHDVGPIEAALAQAGID